MGTLCLMFKVLFGLLPVSSFAFPSEHFTQHASLYGPPLTKHTELQKQQQKVPAGERRQVNTVRVTCHPDSLEIVIEADLFGVGAPVNGAELRLGVEHNDFCRATGSYGAEYRIIAGLLDCGTKHWMTEDSLVYTNLLIYSPLASPDGVIHMDEAVIPIECHYQRKYSLSSSSLAPTWLPFMSTQAAVETLEFDLRIMTNDWQYERSSNVFHLGEPIAIEASVRVGHHMGLRVFISSCVATLEADIYSTPRYVFIENGCLVDSQLPGSQSYFLSRTQDNKLHLVVNAFRFHNEDRGQLYITCHLNAVPVNDAEAPNKACTYVTGRWRSADGNDYLCGQCQSQNEAGQTHTGPSSPGKFGPRGFGKLDEPEAHWRSDLKAKKVWEQEAKVGPVLILPSKKSGPLPAEELPPVLSKISRPALYGSQWRSGINNRVDLDKGLLPDPPSAPDQEEAETEASELEESQEVKNGTDPEDEDADGGIEVALEEASAVVTVKTEAAALDSNETSALGDDGPDLPLPVDVTTWSNATATETDLSDSKDPKR